MTMLQDGPRRPGRVGAGAMAGAVTVAAMIGLLPGPAAAGVGDYDVRFGQNGRLEVAYVGPEFVVQQPDGALLFIGHPAAGMGGEDPTQLELHRYLAGGRPDTGYGGSGQLVVPNPGQSTVTAVAVQPDGKIVIGGAAPIDGSAWARHLARIDGSGAVDASFGTGGRVNGGTLKAFLPGYTGLEVLPNGDIVAWMVDSDGSAGLGSRNVVDRFDRDGRPVSSRTLDDVPITARPVGQGDIVLATLSNSGVRLVRLRRDGSADASFGTNGAIVLPGWSDAQLATSPDRDAIVACGEGQIRRFDAAGRPDTRFGADGSGVVALEPQVDLRLRQCDGLLVRDDGYTVVFASDVQGTFNVSHRTLALGLRPNGIFDPAFGDGTGRSRLRGLSAPDERWWGRQVFATADGNARIAWQVVDRTGDRLRIDAIDLGGAGGQDAVGIAPVRLRVQERSTGLDIRVVRSGTPTGEVTVRYEAVPGSAGTADFAALSGTLQWADGDATPRHLTLPMVSDDLVEGEETLEFRLLDAAGAATIATPEVLTIVDDDALRALRFRESQVTWTTGPGSSVDDTPSLTVLRDEPSAGRVTAYYYMSNGFDACCAGVLAWLGGETDPRAFRVPPEAAGLNQIYVSIFDEEWVDVGVLANVNIVTTPPPPGSGGGGGGGGGGGAGSDDDQGKSSGGGAGGLLEAVALLCLTLLQARARRRREAAVVRGPFG